MSEKDKKLDQIIKTIDANDIKFLKLQFSDIHGLPKSMAVPLKKADDVEDIVNHRARIDIVMLPLAFRHLFVLLVLNLLIRVLVDDRRTRPKR